MQRSLPPPPPLPASNPEAGRRHVSWQRDGRAMAQYVEHDASYGAVNMNMNAVQNMTDGYRLIECAKLSCVTRFMFYPTLLCFDGQQLGGD